MAFTQYIPSTDTSFLFLTLGSYDSHSTCINALRLEYISLSNWPQFFFSYYFRWYHIFGNFTTTSDQNHILNVSHKDIAASMALFNGFDEEMHEILLLRCEKLLRKFFTFKVYRLVVPHFILFGHFVYPCEFIFMWHIIRLIEYITTFVAEIMCYKKTANILTIEKWRQSVCVCKRRDWMKCSEGKEERIYTHTAGYCWKVFIDLTQKRETALVPIDKGTFQTKWIPINLEILVNAVYALTLMEWVNIVNVMFCEQNLRKAFDASVLTMRSSNFKTFSTQLFQLRKKQHYWDIFEEKKHKFNQF